MDLMQRRRALMMGQKPTGQLPRGFREVEYLESTGTQYILTEYRPNADTAQIGFKFQWASPYNNQYRRILGVFRQSPAFGFTAQIVNQPQNMTWRFGTGAWQSNEYSPFSADYYKPYTVLISKDGILIDGNKIASFTGVTSVSSEDPIAIFTFNPPGGNTGPLRIFYVTTEKNDFVPCYRESDNKPGMYDLCGSICPLTNSPFYINAGTGEFLVGPEVN